MSPVVNPGLRRGGIRPPSGASAVFSFNGSINADSGTPTGSFTRSTNAWNPETGLIAPQNLKLHSEFEGGVGDLSTLQNVSIGSLTGFTNAAVFSSGAILKYFQWGAGLSAPFIGEYRIYSCYVQMADLSAPNPSTGIVAGKDMYVTQGAFYPTYIGQQLVDPINSIYRVYWASAAGDTSGNVYLQQAATGSGKSFKVSGCMVERVDNASVTTPSAYIKTTTSAVYAPRYVTGKSGTSILIEEASTNVFLNSTAPVTQSISLTTANSGKWTCSVIGAGTVTSSNGTGTATGHGVASAGTPVTITVTGAGTITYTVAGADAITKVQVENLAYPTSHIVTAGASVTRGAEILTFNPTGILTASQGTIAGWFYLDPVLWGVNKIRDIFFTESTLGTAKDALVIQQNGINTIKFTTANATPTLTTTTIVLSGGQLTKGWHHVALVWGGANPVAYYDSVPTTGVSNNIPSTIGTVAAIGTYSNGASEWFDQAIDQLRIYQRVLSAAEIAQLYKAGR